ncbi:hypothetical protein NDU88_003554 [Pleurodeles waltl]|uniref:Uncharacterized protein n=1 Tax=Pleurodeles waltl TaxID=8319 RepID=A0AAV7QCF3_PLEWA|nr:hypothetical protein NDU88_003554 [Pleurodeles waltl]
MCASPECAHYVEDPARDDVCAHYVEDPVRDDLCITRVRSLCVRIQCGTMCASPECVLYVEDLVRDWGNSKRGREGAPARESPERTPGVNVPGPAVLPSLVEGAPLHAGAATGHWQAPVGTARPGFCWQRDGPVDLRTGLSREWRGGAALPAQHEHRPSH